MECKDLSGFKTTVSSTYININIVECKDLKSIENAYGEWLYKYKHSGM